MLAKEPEIIELPPEAAAVGWIRTKREDKLRFVDPVSGWSGLVVASPIGGAAWQGFGPKGRFLRPMWVQAPSVEEACRAAAEALAEAPALTAQLTHGAGSPGPTPRSGGETGGGNAQRRRGRQGEGNAENREHGNRVRG